MQSGAESTSTWSEIKSKAGGQKVAFHNLIRAFIEDTEKSSLNSAEET